MPPAAATTEETIFDSASDKHASPTGKMASNSALMTGALLTVGITYIAQPGSSLFSWHPVCMALAFTVLMTYGISVFAPGNTLSYRDKVWRHFLCNAGAGLLTLSGFLIIYTNKNLLGKQHFASRHGFVGLIVSMLVVAQAAGSSIFLFPDFTNKLLGISNVKKAKMLHRYGAFVTYVLSMYDLILGFYTNFWTRNVEGLPWTVATLATLFMAGVIVLQVLRGFSKSKK
eukprot:m.31826 g.31826  ORF g.31826 m.31826 type:complete len:229 (-) comp10722_c0_seq1:169-855(-)